MDKVYIVMYYDEEDEPKIVKVFSNKEAAQNYISSRTSWKYDIIEKEIDYE